MFLTHPDNWEKYLERSLFGFDNEYAYTVEHYIHPGDRSIIYLAKLSAIWGVVEITDARTDERHGGGGGSRTPVREAL